MAQFLTPICSVFPLKDGDPTPHEEWQMDNKRRQRSCSPSLVYVIDRLFVFKKRRSDRPYPSSHMRQEGKEIMRVVEIETQERERRYVVIDEEGTIVEPIVRYLKHLVVQEFQSFAIGENWSNLNHIQHC